MLLALVMFKAAPDVNTVQVRMIAAIPMSCIVVGRNNRLDGVFWLAVCLAGYVACCVLLKGPNSSFIATEPMRYYGCFLHHSNGVNHILDKLEMRFNGVSIDSGRPC